MAAEKKPSIYQDRGTIGSSDDLDKYGVWVKSEPQDLSADNSGDTFEPAWENTISSAEEAEASSGSDELLSDDFLNLPESTDSLDFLDAFDATEAELSGAEASDEPAEPSDSIEPSESLDSIDLSSLDSVESLDSKSFDSIDLSALDEENNLPEAETEEVMELELPDMDDLAAAANLLASEETSNSVDAFMEETENASAEEDTALANLEITEEPDFSIFDEITEDNAGTGDVPNDLAADISSDVPEISEPENIEIDLDLDEENIPVFGIGDEADDDEEDADDMLGTTGPGSIVLDQTEEEGASFEAGSSFEEAPLAVSRKEDSSFEEVHERTTPREAELSTQLLVKIADELSSIRSELSSLKHELASLKNEPIKESASTGFFNKSEQEDDDETIALTGDEMNNILNAEDDLQVVQDELTAEDEAPAESQGQGFFNDDEDETIALTGDEMDNILNSADFIEETGADAGEEDTAEDISGGDVLIDDTSNENASIGDISFEDAAVEDTTTGEEISFEDTAEETTISLDDISADLSFAEKEIEDQTIPDSADSLDTAASFEAEAFSAPVDLSQLDEVTSPGTDESDGLEHLRAEGVRPMNSLPEPEETHYLEKDPLIVKELDADIMDLSQAVIDEPDLSSDIQDNPVVEPSLDDIKIDMEMDETGTDDSIEKKTDFQDDELNLDPLASSIIEEEASSFEEIEIPLGDEEEIPIPPEAFDPEEDTAVFSEDAAMPLVDEDLAIIPEGFAVEPHNDPAAAEEDVLQEDTSLAEEPAPFEEVLSIDEPVPVEEVVLPEEAVPTEEPAPEEASASPEAHGASLEEALASEDTDSFEADDSSKTDALVGGIAPIASDTSAIEIPSSLKQELKNVLTYMDDLLESLPDDKIEEFARSEQFDTYKKLFKELGLV